MPNAHTPPKGTSSSSNQMPKFQNKVIVFKSYRLFWKLLIELWDPSLPILANRRHRSPSIKNIYRQLFSPVQIMENRLKVLIKQRRVLKISHWFKPLALPRSGERAFGNPQLDFEAKIKINSNLLLTPSLCVQLLWRVIVSDTF